MIWHQTKPYISCELINFCQVSNDITYLNNMSLTLLTLVLFKYQSQCLNPYLVLSNIKFPILFFKIPDLLTIRDPVWFLSLWVFQIQFPIFQILRLLTAQDPVKTLPIQAWIHSISHSLEVTYRYLLLLRESNIFTYETVYTREYFPQLHESVRRIVVTFLTEKSSLLITKRWIWR